MGTCAVLLPSKALQMKRDSVIHRQKMCSSHSQSQFHSFVSLVRINRQLRVQKPANCGCFADLKTVHLPRCCVGRDCNSRSIYWNVFAILGEKSNDVLKKAPIAGLFATDVGETEPKTDRTEMVCNVLFAVVPFTGEWIPLDEGKISSIHC